MGIQSKRGEFTRSFEPIAKPRPPIRNGITPDHERNAAFLAEWDAAIDGQREAVAHRYGIKNRQSGAVIAHRIRTYGSASSRPAVPGHGKHGIRQ